jgi:hypothetical protein
MKYAKFALAMGMCLLCGLAVVGVVQSGFPAFVSTNVRKAVCSYIGGRFQYGFGDRCFTRSCYARHDCGYWQDDSLRCSKLKAGDPIGEVYFQLGEPHGHDGGQYWWEGWKVDGGKITAEFEGGKLKSLICPDHPAG